MITVVVFFLGQDLSALEASREIEERLDDLALSEHHQIAGIFAARGSELNQALLQALSYSQKEKAKKLILDKEIILSASLNEQIEVFSRLSLAKMSLMIIGEASFDDKQLFFMQKMLKAFMEQEKKLRSKIAKQASQKLAQQGHVFGGKKYGQNQREKRIIKQILILHDEGFSFSAICKKLNDNKINTVHGKKWYPMTVKRIIERQLKNKKK